MEHRNQRVFIKELPKEGLFGINIKITVKPVLSGHPWGRL